MKDATYKLAGDVPEQLKGSELTIPEGESYADVAEQCENEDSVWRAAQQSIDIAKQRIARSTANSEDVEKILADETLDPDERKANAVAHIQAKLDEYRFGARAQGTSKTAEAKKAVATTAKLKEEAANDPELQAKLAALGIEL